MKYANLLAITMNRGPRIGPKNVIAFTILVAEKCTKMHQSLRRLNKYSQFKVQNDLKIKYHYSLVYANK